MARPRKDGTFVPRVGKGAPGKKYVERKDGGIEVQLDVAALATAAETHASYEMLAQIFGVGTATLLNGVYKPIIEKARAVAGQRLLSSQFRNANQNNNATMQIWLGKQYLGQKDVSRVEQTGADGQPMETVVTKRVTAVIPDNGRDGTV